MGDTYERQSTSDLWALLFIFVDMQLELRRAGKMREAVVLRHRCRVIGTVLRRRYADEHDQ